MAVGRAESRVTSSSGGSNIFQEKTEHVGWTAGAGIEHAFTPNWIFGVEYNYVDLGKEKYGGHMVSNGANVAGPEYFVDLKFSTVLARLSYKFGAAPVVARY